MRIAVVAEFYPRKDDPVLGVWAHRQALATRAAGAELSVFVLNRELARNSNGTLRVPFRQPGRVTLDCLDVHYVRYFSPPRRRSYARWGAWAAPALARALSRAGPFDLVHAHNAVPAADAVLRTGRDLPFVLSVHGGDVLWTTHSVPRGSETVSRALARARLVLANSSGIERLAREHGAQRTRVVHLGSDLPPLARRSEQPLIASVGHLVARKRHADVLRALAQVPQARYLVIGDGPELESLKQLAVELAVEHRVEFAGQLEPQAALERSRAAWCFALPSTEEAFGVAYIEAMAAGIPAIGCRGEPGPEEIAAAGGGMLLVAPADPAALARAIVELIADDARREELSRAARETVERSFTWERCGAETIACYEDALR